MTQEVVADASQAVHDDAKGHSGAVARRGNVIVYGRSSFEAELNSLHEVIPYLICDATPLGLFDMYILADEQGESSVKLAISLMSDDEGTIAPCQAVMQSLSVRFNPAGPGQHVPTVERVIRTIRSKVRGIINTLTYCLPI